MFIASELCRSSVSLLFMHNNNNNNTNNGTEAEWKELKYQSLPHTHTFIPLAFDNFHSFGI